jgi:hypothetical protein
VKDSEGVTYRDSQNGYHPDEIQLMLNSTTYSFGYFNSDGSLGHTEYTGLVGWETIRTWANSKGLNGDCLNDGWNRSFMGFDFEQVVGNDVYAKNGGNIVYAKYSEAPENPQYIWDGEKVIPLNSVQGVANLDITSHFTNCWNGNESVTNNNGTLVYKSVSWGGLAYWLGGVNISQYTKLVIEFEEATPCGSQLVIQREGDDNNSSLKYWIDANSTKGEYDLQSWMQLSRVNQIAFQTQDPATIKIKKIYLKGAEGVSGAGEYMYYNGKQVPYLTADQNTYCGDFKEYGSDDDVKIRKQYNGSEVVCLNWKKLVDERLSKGYLPVANSNMKKWVKVQGGADGYYSDWIVTLTEAKSGTPPTPPTPPDNPPVTPPTGFVCRIIAEDLTVGENSDFDFNDVVFDVINGGTTIRLRAAGGELPLYVAGKEVHDAFATKYQGITRTTLVNTGWKGGTLDYDNYYVDIPSGGTYSTPAAAANIPVIVQKQGKPITLTAQQAKVASKVCVGSDYEWCSERQDIDVKFHKADGTKLFQQYVIGRLGDDWKNGNAWYQQRGK